MVVAVRVLTVLALVASQGCDRRPLAREGGSHSTAPSASASAGALASAIPAPLASISPSLRADSGAPKPEEGLDELNFDGLPPVAAAACAGGGHKAFVPQPRSLWAPIVNAVRSAWPERDEYPPNSCIRGVRTRCAPDLDGKPGTELLAEISYRLVQDGVPERERPLRPSCASDQRVPQAVVVALSPPTPERREWLSLGIVGYAVRGIGEGGTVIRLKRFVRLPQGAVAVHARAFTEGFSEQEEVLLTYPEASGTWRTVSTRRLPDARP